MNKIECRIIKNTRPDGREYYTIEQKKKRFFGGYKWKEAGFGEGWGRTTYETLEDAKENLCWYDGRGTKTEVVSTPHKVVYYDYMTTPPKIIYIYESNT
jgi:hypothetical protein